MTIEEAAGPAGPKIMGNCKDHRLDQGNIMKRIVIIKIIKRKLLEGDFGKVIGDFDEKGGLMVVMIVLTKVELEWADVSIDEGKKLQDVLEEIERERES
ncbi:hypothetical protein GH714_026024 [Hevea brasiliensis]|uniref:Uncharacterized protein n=1 Tax=Hevea brasiliensis TaxID=3981 RepID=A0A6A6MN24_HEVBR|nr:hypothetical protein GH714_026024 [Hevea brasiliensis]